MDYEAILLTIDVEGGYEGKYVSVNSLLQRSQRVVVQVQNQTCVDGNIF